MDDKNENKLEYNVQKRAKAGTAATFRGIVAVYIGYLGYRIIRGELDGESTLPGWVSWTVGVLFIAAAIGFIYYLWKRWRADVEAARLPQEDITDGEDTPEE